MGLSLYDGPMETFKYIWVNIWCMPKWILSQNCRNTLPLDTVDQLVRSANYETLLYFSKLGIRHRLDGLISDCENVPVLPRGYYLKFSEVRGNSMKF